MHSKYTPEHVARFWSRVDKSGGPDACWPWTSAIGGHGYGAITFTLVPGEHRVYLAHRVAYELTCGPIPEGMQILHSCDNRPCCNPAHLRPGTPRDNAHDMLARGRNRNNPPRGEAHHKTAFTAEHIREIRARAAAGASLRALSVSFGVGKTAIASIIKRKAWRHVA